MIELLDTPTFVVDDFFDVNNIKLFNYMDHENISYEILELCSADLPYRDTVYYPVPIKEINDDTNFINHINPRALEMAYNEQLIIVFMYEGIVDVVSEARINLLSQMTAHNLSLNVIRFVTSIKPAELIPPFIFFPFQEMDAKIAAVETDHYYGVNEKSRKKIFTFNSDKDTAHARVLAASMWYHALHNKSYFNYTDRVLDKSIINSDSYKWSDQFSSTATLIDMFGQQLPITTPVENENDFYDESYWHFVLSPSFPITTCGPITEMFGPILNYQPFVCVGPPGTLKLLRSMGYKTFKTYVNEDYDRVINDEQRMYSLFRLVYEMSMFTDTELLELNEKLIPILKHNHTHFLASKRYRLVNLLES